MFQRLPPIVKSRLGAVKDFIPYHTEILRLKQLYLEMQCSALRCLFGFVISTWYRKRLKRCFPSIISFRSGLKSDMVMIDLTLSSFDIPSTTKGPGESF